MYRTKKRQYILVFLIAICGFLLASLHCFAVEEGTIYSNSVSIFSGQEISIPIQIKNNPGIMGFSMKIKYDPNVLNAKSVDVGKLLPNGLFDYSIDPNKQGIVDVIFTNTEDIKNDGELFLLSFNVISTEVLTSQITITIKQEDTFNEQWEDVAINCEPIKLFVNQVKTESSTTMEEGSSVPQQDPPVDNNTKVYERETTITDIAGSTEQGYGKEQQTNIEEETMEADVVVQAIERVFADHNVTSFDEIEEAEKEEIVSAIGAELQEVDPERYRLPDDLSIEEKYTEYQLLYESALEESGKTTGDDNSIIKPKVLNRILIVSSCIVVIFIIGYVIFRIKRRKKA